MPRPLTVACLQTPPVASFDEAVDEALGLARRAVEDGAELVCLPEYCGGLKVEDGRLAPPVAAEAAHPVLAALRDFAAETGTGVLVGSLAIEAPGGKLYNRGFLLDGEGAIRARYDKIHLFDVDLSATERYRESDVIAPGGAAVVASAPWGRLGMSVCYDLRFASLYRDLAKAGAEILAVPAAFTKTTGEAHWHVLNRARAIETGAFVVAPCSAGVVPGGGAVYGHSLIVDPWGAVLVDGGAAPGVAMAQIDLDAVAEARRRIPALSHDRPFDSAGG